MKYVKLYEEFINEGTTNGDCYHAAGNLAINFIGDKNAKLVHGMVHGQGKLKGLKYGHAWVEYKDSVLDHSNGNKHEIPKAVYYALGNIDPDSCFYYTPKETIKWTMKTKHWGPWEMSGETIKVNEGIPINHKDIGKHKRRLSKKELDEIKDLELMTESNLDIVDFSEIDPQKEYDEINKLLFNNELPKIKIVWSNRKSSGGHVRSVRNRQTGKKTLVELAISKFFEVTEEHFRNVLAHEMIHVHNIHNGLQDMSDMLTGGHGDSFVKEMDRINNLKKGFNITVKGDFTSLNVSKKSMKHPLVVALLDIDGKRAMAVMKERTYATEGNDIINIYKWNIDRGKMKRVEITFVKSMDPNLMKYKIQRSFKRNISYNKVTPEQWKTIISGEVIKHEELISDDATVKQTLQDDKERKARQRAAKKQRGNSLDIFSI